jgi:hypothetical protein
MAVILCIETYFLVLTVAGAEPRHRMPPAVLGGLVLLAVGVGLAVIIRAKYLAYARGANHEA